MAENKPKNKALNYVFISIIALLFGVLGSIIGNYLLRKLPSTVISQSKQVVIDQQTAVTNVSNKVGPSVVSIVSGTTQVDPYTGDSTLAKTGAGTGIIVTSDGLIMTNKHVVDGSQSFTITTSDNKEYPNAKIVAVDTNNDLAFLRVDAKSLQPADLGDSDKVQVGQSVVAIGNALGQFQNTVTTGVISGKSRPITASGGNGGSENLTNLFQTDAAINPGNSGGPLVDIEGKVIGINTAVAGSAQNIGFAIPINDAKVALDSVIKTGKIIRPYLGVRYITINEQIAKENNLPVANGALLYSSGNQIAVLPSSPASKAGLKQGDIITEIDGVKIDQNNTIGSVIGKKKPGEKIKITFIRDGKQQSTSAQLSENQ